MRFPKFREVAFILAALPLAAACNKHSDAATGTEAVKSASIAVTTAAPAATAPARDPALEASEYFKRTCTVCHGEDGRGDGPGAAALEPKPRDYTNAEWQGSVTDEQIAKTILQGGAAVGKSPIMPANPQLKEKPEVVKELVKIIRGFKK
jgi:cytochrome c553